MSYLKEESMNSKLRHLTPQILTAALQADFPHLRGLRRLKVHYRPAICPLHLLLEEIDGQKSIFDIGCGGGTLLWLTQKYLKPIQVGGVEICDKLVSEAKESLGPNADVEVYNGIDLPQKLSNYDYIVLNDVLHHVPANRQLETIQNIARLMKAGSRLIFKDIDASRKGLVLFNKLHDFIIAGEIGHEISADQAIRYLDLSGLQVVKKMSIRMLLYPHYLLVAEEPAI